VTGKRHFQRQLVHDGGQSEISDTGSARWSNENIGLNRVRACKYGDLVKYAKVHAYRLEVSVHDVFAVQILEACGYIRNLVCKG
jgi:hypothetical protein